MLSKTLLSGLTLLSLTACTVPLTRAPETVVVRLRPPSELLQPCPVPKLQGQTNRALAEAYERRGRSLDACNADKAALREWANELPDAK